MSGENVTPHHPEGNWICNRVPDDDEDFRAVDIEIYEKITDPPFGVIKPNRIRINGVECMTPEGAPVTISGLLDGASMLATVTLFVRSLKVGVRHDHA